MKQMVKMSRWNYGKYVTSWHLNTRALPKNRSLLVLCTRCGTYVDQCEAYVVTAVDLKVRIRVHAYHTPAVVVVVGAAVVTGAVREHAGSSGG